MCEENFVNSLNAGDYFRTLVINDGKMDIFENVVVLNASVYIYYRAFAVSRDNNNTPEEDKASNFVFISDKDDLPQTYVQYNEFKNKMPRKFEVEIETNRYRNFGRINKLDLASALLNE